MQSNNRTPFSFWRVSGRVLPVAMVLACASASQAQQPPANLDEYVKLVRTDVQNQKSQLIGAALELSAAESAVFWPVYKQHEAEISKIGEERYAAIKDYAANYATLTPAKATELTDRALALEEKRLALVKRTLAQVRTVLPAPKAARWYQVEMAPRRWTCAWRRRFRWPGNAGGTRRRRGHWPGQPAPDPGSDSHHGRCRLRPGETRTTFRGEHEQAAPSRGHVGTAAAKK